MHRPAAEPLDRLRSPRRDRLFDRIIAMNRRVFISRLAVGSAATAATVLLPRAEPAGAVSIDLSGVVEASDGFLNVRTGPSTARTLLESVPSGTRLALLQTSGDWFKVATGRSTGWAHSGSIVVSGPSALVLTYGIQTRPRVALTFDAGSDAGYTSQILDLLARYKVPSSFGLTGGWAQSYPDLVRRISTNGHQLINHTLNHVSYTGYSTNGVPLSPAKRVSQLVANEEILVRIAGAGAGALAAPVRRLRCRDTAPGRRAQNESLRDVGDRFAWLERALGIRGSRSGTEPDRERRDRALPCRQRVAGCQRTRIDYPVVARKRISVRHRPTNDPLTGDAKSRLVTHASGATYSTCAVKARC